MANFKKFVPSVPEAASHGHKIWTDRRPKNIRNLIQETRLTLSLQGFNPKNPCCKHLELWHFSADMKDLGLG